MLADDSFWNHIRIGDLRVRIAIHIFYCHLLLDHLRVTEQYDVLCGGFYSHASRINSSLEAIPVYLFSRYGNRLTSNRECILAARGIVLRIQLLRQGRTRNNVACCIYRLPIQIDGVTLNEDLHQANFHLRNLKFLHNMRSTIYIRVIYRRLSVCWI